MSVWVVAPSSLTSEFKRAWAFFNSPSQFQNLWTYGESFKTNRGLWLAYASKNINSESALIPIQQLTQRSKSPTVCPNNKTRKPRQHFSVSLNTHWVLSLQVVSTNGPRRKWERPRSLD